MTKLSIAIGTTGIVVGVGLVLVFAYFAMTTDIIDNLAGVSDNTDRNITKINPPKVIEVDKWKDLRTIHSCKDIDYKTDYDENGTKIKTYCLEPFPVCSNGATYPSNCAACQVNNLYYRLPCA